MPVHASQNGTLESVRELIKSLGEAKIPHAVDVVVAPMALHLAYVQQNIAGEGVQVAAQNVSATGAGAYTGEISAEALVDFGLRWVIVGHSERRALYGESEQVVAQKVDAALSKGLQVIACIGEQLEDRKAGRTMEVLKAQLEAIVTGTKGRWNKLVLAYEPVWAIGTGVVASPQEAQDTHREIRGWLAGAVDAKTAQGIRVIYGGSVKADNCKDLISQPDIDGFLVGGASLVPGQFLAIIEAAGLRSQL